MRINPDRLGLHLSSRGISKALLQEAWRMRKLHKGGQLRFYYPYPKFPAISITGSWCALRCKHCLGRYLEGMIPLRSPSEFKEFCVKLERRGGVGLLVSGGCDHEGRVPLERFYDALRWVKENTELIINVHTGLVDEERAEEIASTEIDIASIDIVGSEETIRGVYGLKATVEDYRETLINLLETSIPVVAPHLCVGLDHGRIVGEGEAIKILQDAKPKEVVFIVFTPTRRTPMEDVKPPSPADVGKVIALTRLLLPKADLSLGCMRPRTEREKLEMLALRAGVNKMVIPSKKTRAWAESKHLDALSLDGCCSIMER
jgi:hypothetical protein